MRANNTEAGTAVSASVFVFSSVQQTGELRPSHEPTWTSANQANCDEKKSQIQAIGNPLAPWAVAAFPTEKER